MNASERHGGVDGGGRADATQLVRALQRGSRVAGPAIYLGEGNGGLSWASPERSVLALGKSRSGKTSSIIIPNVLAAPGPVVSTSTKPDVLTATAPARAKNGSVLLYDPTGTVTPPCDVKVVGWSPVNSTRDWDGALRIASAIVSSSQSASNGSQALNGADHWHERAAALLAPLLHAAALNGLPMHTVTGWIDQRLGEVGLDILSERVGDDAVSTALLKGILLTDSREQSGIWSTASGVLSAYRSEGAISSTSPPYLDPVAFCEGSHTLYICAPGQAQELVAPLIVGMLSDIRDAVYQRARSGRSGPPLLMALDEAANIAPLPDLPSLVSEGGGQGILLLVCLQDLSQARRRWGKEADAFVSLFGTTVVLAGIADVPTLETMSILAGDEEVLSRTIGSSMGHDRRLHPSISVTGVRQRRLPPDVIGRGRPGMALCIDAGNRVGWVSLTPSYAREPWRSIVNQDRTPFRGPLGSHRHEEPLGAPGQDHERVSYSRMLGAQRSR